jgi:hypothetical protein
MPKRSRSERNDIARRRLRRVLNQHTVANARTLEQKISDAGPSDLRIDPHILTRVRNTMHREGELSVIKHAGIDWYALPEADPNLLQTRLELQAETLIALRQRSLSQRMGQTLEIATYKALLQLENSIFFGRFKDLEEHLDDQIYRKEEPPQHLGSRELQGDERLDFLVSISSGTWLGLECKNIREWLYPDRTEIRDAIDKCLRLDCIPVIIGRRIPYVTFRLLQPCGVIIHQTYNQLFPASDQDLADRARHKRNLGYHDIRVGNVPDDRLVKFVTKNLLTVADAARERFDAYKDLLEAFVSHDIPYDEFAARVRRRQSGSNEDRDWEVSDPADWDEY